MKYYSLAGPLTINFCKSVSLVSEKSFSFLSTFSRSSDSQHAILGKHASSVLSFDVSCRTNPEAFRGRGVFRIVADEGFALYRGWGWTAARNAPGSFAVGYLYYYDRFLCLL
jgi:hypothetical protein